MRSMLPDRDVLVRTLRIPTAHGSIPALLPDGFSSLRPVLRINAEICMWNSIPPQKRTASGAAGSISLGCI